MRALALLLAAWLPPVDGPVARPFHYDRPFAAGQHRGVDLGARPGTPVRAACRGTVVHAGGAPAGELVSMRCGDHRVSYLPLAQVAVSAGARVDRGDRIGIVATGHGGALHLGVREERDRFAYVDPLPLLEPPRQLPPPVARAPSRLPRREPPRPARLPEVRDAAPADLPLAPWTAFAGLALTLAGAGVRLRGRRPAAARVRRRPWPTTSRRRSTT